MRFPSRKPHASGRKLPIVTGGNAGEVDEVVACHDEFDPEAVPRQHEALKLRMLDHDQLLSRTDPADRRSNLIEDYDRRHDRPTRKVTWEAGVILGNGRFLMPHPAFQLPIQPIVIGSDNTGFGFDLGVQILDP
jgi:hypothetical protein